MSQGHILWRSLCFGGEYVWLRETSFILIWGNGQVRRNGLHVFKIQKSKLVLGIFIAFLCLGGTTEQKAALRSKFCFLPPTPLEERLLFLEPLWCIIKTQFGPILGCITLLFKADPAHSSSKFGSDCLGDLAYTENQAAFPFSPQTPS